MRRRQHTRQHPLGDAAPAGNGRKTRRDRLHRHCNTTYFSPDCAAQLCSLRAKGKPRRPGHAARKPSAAPACRSRPAMRRCTSASLSSTAPNTGSATCCERECLRKVERVEGMASTSYPPARLTVADAGHLAISSGESARPTAGELPPLSRHTANRAGTDVRLFFRHAGKS